MTPFGRGGGSHLTKSDEGVTISSEVIIAGPGTGNGNHISYNI